MARVPLHTVLDTVLGFSFRDLVLEKPEDVEEFRRRIQNLREEHRRQKASGKEQDKEGGPREEGGHETTAHHDVPCHCSMQR